MFYSRHKIVFFYRHKIVFYYRARNCDVIVYLISSVSSRQFDVVGGILLFCLDWEMIALIFASLLGHRDREQLVRACEGSNDVAQVCVLLTPFNPGRVFTACSIIAANAQFLLLL